MSAELLVVSCDKFFPWFEHKLLEKYSSGLVDLYDELSIILFLFREIKSGTIEILKLLELARIQYLDNVVHQTT